MGSDNGFDIIFLSKRRCSKRFETCAEMDPGDQEEPHLN